MSTLRTILVFSGVATALGLAVGALSGAVKAEVRRARDELFEVGPNCKWIHFKGFGEKPAKGAELDAHIGRARTYYFDPLIASLKTQGKDISEIRIAVMKDLFPMCRWPPETLFSTQGAVWLLLGRWIELEAMRGDICEPLYEPPLGMICVERGGVHVLERLEL